MWVWRSAKPAFGSKSHNLFPWPSTQYLWNGTAQAQGWDFYALSKWSCRDRDCEISVILRGATAGSRSQCIIPSTSVRTSDIFLGNKSHSESFMLLHSLSPLPSYLLWVNFKPYPQWIFLPLWWLGAEICICSQENSERPVWRSCGFPSGNTPCYQLLYSLSASVGSFGFRWSL